MKFAQNFYTGKLSFEEAKKEEEEVLKKIDELEKRSKRISAHLKDDNRKK